MEDTIISSEDLKTNNNISKENLLLAILVDQIETLATWNNAYLGELEQIDQTRKNIELINILVEKIQSL